MPRQSNLDRISMAGGVSRGSELTLYTAGQSVRNPQLPKISSASLPGFAIVLELPPVVAPGIAPSMAQNFDERLRWLEAEFSQTVFVGGEGAAADAAQVRSASLLGGGTRNRVAYGWEKYRNPHMPFIKQSTIDFSKWEIHSRVTDQLRSENFVRVFGQISKKKLLELAHNPNAEFFLDKDSKHINVVQKVNDKLMRITIPKEEFKVISFGVLKERNYQNYLISDGRYVNLQPSISFNRQPW